MAGRGKAKGKRAVKVKLTPEQRERIAVEATAGRIEMPAQQIANTAMVKVDTPVRDDKPVSLHTVRKLTRIEMLQRAGTINADEAKACEWFAEVHALAWDTVGCTANYEGAGGGGFGPSDLLARYRKQAEARADYWFARDLIAKPDIELFELIVCKGHSIGTAAEAMFEALKRSQAMHRATLQLRRAANMLHAGIAHRLPA